MGKRAEDNVEQDTESRNMRWIQGIKLHNKFEPLASCLDDVPTPPSAMNRRVPMAPNVARRDSFSGFQSSIKRVAVPHYKASSIIGRRGENVKRIQASSGAMIVVSNTRNVDLIGTPEQIRRAEQLIKDYFVEDADIQNINLSSHSCDPERFILVDGLKVKLKYYDLYSSIKATYGDIRRPSVLDASKMAVAWIISDILSIVQAMSQVSLLNVTVDILDDWNKKICLAEHFNYNVAWLRVYFNELENEFSRKVEIDAGLAEFPSQSKVKQNEVESIEAMIALLTSRLESARESSSVLQSNEEDLLAQITLDKPEDATVENYLLSGFKLLSCVVSSKLFFFSFLMFVMFIVFP